MTVSILVPIYGVERYIERCAVSLFEQTYKDIEYVFVDDCTPDESIAVLRRVVERYPECRERVRIVSHESNGGLGAARATALQLATGDTVMHVDSDDYLPSDAVQRLVEGMEKTGADIVDGAFKSVGKDADAPVVSPYKERKTASHLRLLLCQNIIAHNVWARLYRRNVYSDNDIWAVKGIDYSEDYCLTARLFLHARRATVEEVVYYYNVENVSSYTHGMSDKNVRSMIAASKTVYEHFLRHDPDGAYRSALELGMVNMVRDVRRYGNSLMDETMFYRPQGWLSKTLTWLFRSRCPYAIAKFFYLATRRIYALSVS